MFERFTDRARRVVVQAQEESRLLNHNYIGTEHLLLGLLREDGGVAAEALASLEVGLDAAREQVAEIVGRGQEAPSGHIPFTPRAKKVLELSLREALQLGHPYIGPGAHPARPDHRGAWGGRRGARRAGRPAGADPGPGARTGAARPVRASRPAAQTARPAGLTVTPAQFQQLMNRLAAIDRRLAAIDRRLAAIERQPGPGEPPAEAEPG